MIIIHLFIACVNQNIVLSSLPPSQSSVDHKEFKRCGPFDPYNNAKVCTTCCQNNISLWSASLLSYCVCLLCLIWSVAAARGSTSACRDMGKLLISPAIRLITVLWLSTHVNIVISNCVWCVIKWVHYNIPSTFLYYYRESSWINYNLERNVVEYAANLSICNESL